MGTKVCFICKEELPHNMFFSDLTRKDGLGPYCKPCNIKRELEYKQGIANKAKMTTEQLIEENKKIVPKKTEKICKSCRVNKSIYEYYLSKNGHASSDCIECQKQKRTIRKGAPIREYGTKKYDENGVEIDEVLLIHRQIRAGKITQTPEEFEADCKRLKILHHREWTIDLTRLKQISDEQHELDSKMRIGVKRSKMEVQGIDTDEMSDDEIENYFNI